MNPVDEFFDGVPEPVDDVPEPVDARPVPAAPVVPERRYPSVELASDGHDIVGAFTPWGYGGRP